MSWFGNAWTFVKAVFGVPNLYDHDIVNLVEVEPGLWRSGQPTTDAEWAYLRSLGVRLVVKLNFDDEGSDAWAAKAGIIVVECSVQPDGDKDVWDNVKNVFVQPDAVRLSAALQAIKTGVGVLVHCTHGHDRTGLVIGMHRVLHDGWTKERAYEEMLERGFHPELVGLSDFWNGFGGDK